MNAEPRKFELLNYVWLEGFVPYYFEGDGSPLYFSTVEEVLAELQDDFDTVAQEMADGDRDADCGYSPDEFRIRCIQTGEEFNVDLVDGKLRVSS